MDPSLKKKILILYASAGHGHEKAAKAIFEALQKEASPHIELRIEDTLAHVPKYFGGPYRDIYLFMIAKAPWLWGAFYYLIDNIWIYRLIFPLRYLHNRLFCGPLERFIQNESPDVVVCAHFMGSEVSGYLKQKGRLSARLVTLITDYLPHPIWLSAKTDYYLGAIADTGKQLEKWGVPKDRIRTFGIPVEGKFSQAIDRQALKQAMGLNNGSLTALLTSGGAGIGSTEAIVAQLTEQPYAINLMVICGTNKALLDRLSALTKLGQLKLKLFGFVNNMHELMEASDLVIGKSGGLTVTESLVKQRPMIVIRPIPGQESRNADCLKRYDAGYVAHSVEQVIQTLSHIVKHPEELSGRTLNAGRLASPASARQIATFIKELSSR